jgi:hypothetical protein
MPSLIAFRLVQSSRHLLAGGLHLTLIGVFVIAGVALAASLLVPKVGMSATETA